MQDFVENEDNIKSLKDSCVVCLACEYDGSETWVEKYRKEKLHNGIVWVYHKTTNQKRKFCSSYVILRTGRILSQEWNKKVYKNVNR